MLSSHHPTTLVPGTAPVPSQPVMGLYSLSPQGRNLGVLLLEPLGWREQEAVSPLQQWPSLLEEES